MAEFLGNNKCNNNIISYILILKKKLSAIISKLKMNRRGKISPVILVACIIVGALIVSMAVLIHSCDCSKLKFELIASNLADEQEYREGYKCVQFSAELLSRLNNAGYSADYCTSSTHAWVEARVPIEATNGVVIDPSEMKNYDAYKNKTCNTYRGEELG